MRWPVMVTLLTCGLLATGCATTTTGSAVPTSGTPVCAGGPVVRPAGAPYCYPLPTGFTDVSDHITLQYRSADQSHDVSAVGVARLDAIIVAIYPLHANSDQVAPADLAKAVTAALPDPAANGITTGKPAVTTLDGARTVRLELDKPGAYASTIYFAFRGYTELEVDCQWARQQATVARGCASVRNSIRFVDPPR